MRVLFVSGELIGSAICHELQREGHDIKLYIEQEGWKRCLDGIIPKTDNWKKELSWVGTEGLIVFDDVCFGKDQDKLRKEGYRVVGGSAEADKLENNREYFQTVLKSCGVQTLPSYDFCDAERAIDFINDNPGYWVVKQNTHFGAFNYVGEQTEGKDVIAILESYRRHNMSAHLQKKAIGIEVGVARYFDGENWVGPIEVNHEHKRMCNDDIGPLTPEMGTVMWFSDNEELPLFKETLGKLKPFLKKVNFKGDFDINCIVEENTAWPLEATARFGAPSTELQAAMMETSWGDFLNSLADGTKFQPKFSKGFGVVTSIAVPPYPFTKEMVNTSLLSSEAVQLFLDDSLSDNDRKNIYFEEVSKYTNIKTNKEGYHWTGTNGWTMHITSTADKISTARANTHKIIEKIILPKKFYRTDIGIRVENYDLPTLKKWGWL